MNNEENDSTSDSVDDDDDGYSRSEDSMSCDDPIRQTFILPKTTASICCVSIVGAPELFIRQKQGKCADV
jgi:hypothetical protein